MSKKEKDSAVLLDLGGVLFENNPNIKQTTRLIQNLIRGKNIEATAKALGVEKVMEGIKQTPEFVAINEDKKNQYMGSILLNYVRSKQIISDQDFLDARIDMVRVRDEQILNAIRKTFPLINVAVATDDVQIVRQVIGYYYPEIAPHLQIITSDPDIQASKTCRLFYDKASYRLNQNGILVPTENMILVDDGMKNIAGITEAGGTGVYFDPNAENANLQDTVLTGIENGLRR